MATAAQKDWKQEFGIAGWNPPHLFTSVQQLNDAAGKVPQSHALRRAFEHEELKIDGILCHERTPVIYFRQVKKIDPAEITKIHRAFWNQGVAPILVVIAPDQVHVYSGLEPPAATPTDSDKAPGFVETLNRVEKQLRSFLLSVESGEYFHIHRKSFDPDRRVDRDLLRNLQVAREKLGQAEAARLDPQAINALLCRLVFTCYLFDRGVIDRDYLKTLRVHSAAHLRDILAKKPRTDAKADLYRLFERLGTDFNGDLFSDDLEAESRQIRVEHLDILDKFFHGTDVQSGQQAFWPYDFGIIPIETISAIYEHFLKAAGEQKKREAGAFYTPRFLAELVLDVALEGVPFFLDKRFLDPACGSGIFLVGLFNRLAEEWNRKNPGARYDRRANGLLQILRENLYGVDRNPTACQITAFSLYLAFLDQLSPPDIRELQRKGKFLPRLVYDPEASNAGRKDGVICCADFFTPQAELPAKAHFVVGNPPWGSATDRSAPVARWCAERNLPFPDRQVATAFAWKAAEHLEDGGKACFVLPYGILFHHSTLAVSFQQEFFRKHAVDRVLNLVDYQYFLFEDSRAPAVVLRYRKEKPSDSAHRIEYWAPKTDWAVAQAELVTILPQDRSSLTIREVLDDLKGDDAPLIWKERFWATPRDWRLLDRLSLLPRLRDIVGQPGKSGKRWLIAEGFQPLGKNDDPAKGKTLKLPSKLFVEATASALNLFLLPSDCTERSSQEVTVRGRSNKNTEIFRAPHILVTQGYSRVAFADFDVSFRHAVRGIRGPDEDRDLLIFLTAYLRSDLARFFLFHTSSNWGVSRAKIHVEELLRLPLPLPEQAHDPKRCRCIVREVAKAVTEAAERSKTAFTDRDGIVRQTQQAVEKLVEEYFDIDEIERMLIADTARLVIPSVRPSRSRPDVPSVRHSNDTRRAAYTRLLCDTLNGWAKKEYRVHGKVSADTSLGVGMVVLEKTRRDESPAHLNGSANEILKAIGTLQRTAAKGHGTFQLVRGAKVFHRNLLYITKPLGQRFWTDTAALNDADEIAATILTRSAREGA
jgi:hypothetical protein